MTKTNTGKHIKIETTQMYLDEEKQVSSHTLIETTQIYIESETK